MSSRVMSMRGNNVRSKTLGVSENQKIINNVVVVTSLATKWLTRTTLPISPSTSHASLVTHRLLTNFAN